MSKELKDYLGDSVYAEVKDRGYGIMLTTENGDGPTNRIYLEKQVYEALVRFVKRMEDGGKLEWSAMPMLVIDDAVRAEIERVKQYADAHRYTMNDCIQCFLGFTKPAGDNPGHTLIIPDGWRVVYSIDSQRSPTGEYFCHHLSVSGPTKHKLPSKAVVQTLVDAFGINRKIKDALIVYAEATRDEREAVNIIFPMPEDQSSSLAN